MLGSGVLLVSTLEMHSSTGCGVVSSGSIVGYRYVYTSPSHAFCEDWFEYLPKQQDILHHSEKLGSILHTPPLRGANCGAAPSPGRGSRSEGGSLGLGCYGSESRIEGLMVEGI